MLRAEAAWLAARMAEVPSRDLFPMLNVGSSTAHFRAVRQPWIDGLVFVPVQARGQVVKHLDMKGGDGIDLAGDVMDPAFHGVLSSYKFRSILCSNVLEHVPDRVRLSRCLRNLVPSAGYLIVTVPRRFPYHPDPIDTGFRPSMGELLALFPGMEVVRADDVDCGSFFDSLTYGWRELLARIAWVFLPFVRWRGWTANLSRLMWMGRRFSATCVVLRRPPVEHNNLVEDLA